MNDPNFRALCAELLEALKNAIRVVYREDGTQHISTADDVIARADAALAAEPPITPPAPQPGEVAGIAEWLNKRGQMADLGVKDWYFRAATLLQQLSAPAPVAAEMSSQTRLQWFFYSGFEKQDEYTRAYFNGTFSTDLTDPRTYLNKAKELISRDRNCSPDVLCLTSLTPLEVSK